MGGAEGDRKLGRHTRLDFLPASGRLKSNKKDPRGIWRRISVLEGAGWQRGMRVHMEIRS